MNFSLAYLKSEQQFILRDFSQTEDSPSSKIIDVEDMQNSSIDAIIYPNKLAQSPEIIAKLEGLKKFTPILSEEEAEIREENIEKAKFDEIFPAFSKLNNNWTLQNNILTIENLFDHIKHLKELLPNDRTAFFEELWFLLKKNLGASNFTMIYNHLKKAQKENEKNKLIRVKIEGKNIPSPIEGGEIEEKIMKTFESEFHDKFSIIEFDPHKGELTMTATVNQGPVLMMAKIYTISRLQKSIVKAIFDGINS